MGHSTETGPAKSDPSREKRRIEEMYVFPDRTRSRTIRSSLNVIAIGFPYCPGTRQRSLPHRSRMMVSFVSSKLSSEPVATIPISQPAMAYDGYQPTPSLNAPLQVPLLGENAPIGEVVPGANTPRASAISAPATPI